MQKKQLYLEVMHNATKTKLNTINEIFFNTSIFNDFL